jgi:NAD(P)H-dependent FMN reductase
MDRFVFYPERIFSVSSEKPRRRHLHCRSQSLVLRAKPVTVIGASTGIFGAVWAQAEVRKVLVAIGAHILEQGAMF